MLRLFLIFYVLAIGAAAECLLVEVGGALMPTWDEKKHHKEFELIQNSIPYFLD